MNFTLEGSTAGFKCYPVICLEMLLFMNLKSGYSLTGFGMKWRLEVIALIIQVAKIPLVT